MYFFVKQLVGVLVLSEIRDNVHRFFVLFAKGSGSGSQAAFGEIV